MNGGGSQTVTQTNLPPYARKYFEDMMDRANKLSKQEYQPYGGQRIAGFNFDQKAAARQLRGLSPVNNQMKRAGNTLNKAANYQTRMWDAGAAQEYMSPYMEQVLDRQKAGAINEYDRQRGDRATRAMAASSFGGSRQAVQDAIAEESLSRQMMDLDATGRQKAWEQAQSMFTSDQGRDLSANQMRLGAGQAQAELGGQIFGQSRQNIQDRMGLGNQRQAQNQKELDLRYSDFENQRDYDRQTLGWLSSILRGVPINNNSTVSQYGQGSNPWSQMMGLGLGGMGMWGGQKQS